MRETLDLMANPLGADRLERSDATLVGATLAGDRSGFEQLVRRYERPSRATCFAVLKDWHLAEDAAQDGFVAAYRSLRSLRDADSFGAWLLTIMHHRAVRLASQRRATVPLHLQAHPAAEATVETDADRVIAAVARLPEHERVVVLLHYFEGHAVAAIARVCGRPVGTITKQLSRAHRRLQKLLEKGERS